MWASLIAQLVKNPPAMWEINMYYLVVPLLFFNNFINLHLFLAVLSLHCCAGFPVVAASRGYSLVALHGLLSAVVSLAVEHRLYHVCRL